MAAVKLCTSSLLRNPLAVRLAVARTLSTSHAAANVAKEDIHPVYFKHKENQKAWRVDTGEMNYVKGGSSKKILFYTTALLIVVGVVQSTRWFYVRAFPQKN